ncbi:hypothetical protein [Nocardia sp. GTS18]|uniref:hypothetical protein n=1 Tax=Nocardia sp. GTS18 TaxID=1778064 RepID=UPI0015EF4AB5|nr:hypothetical protein [Nocardia sp. GTS18]
MADTMTRPEFELAAHLGVAGVATALAPATVERWREADPGWKGKHWAYTEPDDLGARRLHPVNLTNRTNVQS